MNSLSNNKIFLSNLASKAVGGLISVEETAELFLLSKKEASIKLRALTKKGWVLRIKRGLYLVLPIDAHPENTTAEDPWVLASKVFSPSYIGGWSALEHWGLTEQMFRSIIVYTTSNVRSKSVKLLNYTFVVIRVSKIQEEGLEKVWRLSSQINISSPERTIIDCLKDPKVCGGIRMLSDILSEYKQKKEGDTTALLNLLDKIGNGASWKRLGFIAEKKNWDKKIVEKCKKNISSGFIRLDPSIKEKGSPSKDWGLWLNNNLSVEND